MKTLYRSRNHKVIAGVAGGIAEYFDIDPVFIRVLFVISVFASGVGIIAYIVLWIISPQEPFERYIHNPNEQYHSGVNYESKETGNFVHSSENQENIFETQSDDGGKSETKGKLKIFGGLILVILGLIILLDELIPEFDFAYIWSIILILIGFYIIYSSPKKRINNE